MKVDDLTDIIYDTSVSKETRTEKWLTIVPPLLGSTFTRIESIMKRTRSPLQERAKFGDMVHDRGFEALWPLTKMMIEVALPGSAIAFKEGKTRGESILSALLALDGLRKAAGHVSDALMEYGTMDINANTLALLSVAEKGSIILANEWKIPLENAIPSKGTGGQSTVDKAMERLLDDEQREALGGIRKTIHDAEEAEDEEFDPVKNLMETVGGRSMKPGEEDELKRESYDDDDTSGNDNPE